jgi:hypothetical protein
MFPMSKYRMAQWSAALNFVGALLVFLSFQATSSDFFLTHLGGGEHALCVGKEALVIWGVNRMQIGIPNGCAGASETPKVAIVALESPTLEKFGWGMLLLGFFLQTFSIEKPSPLKCEEVINRNKKLNPNTGLPHSPNPK